MRVFKNKAFSRFARKEGIDDDELKTIVPQLETDNADADLGGGVYKMRVARPGEGKSGGYRVIVFFRSGERTFFIEGYAKSDSANISDKELRRFRKTAKYVLSYTEKQVEVLVKAGTLTEILEEKHEEVSRQIGKINP